LLIAECGGRADAAAQQLGRTPAWVSQRRNLLKLDPELQSALRAGELAIRLARDLARVPQAEQVAAWEAEQARRAAARDATGETDSDQDQLTAVNRPRRPPTVRVLTKALSKYEPEPAVLAEALREYLGNDDLLHALVAALEKPSDLTG
jgi:ParB family chromosome partitioning protein